MQSNNGTAVSYNLNDWMLNVRKMEELGGAMGLSESINTPGLTSASSNNIDVHMEKNSEYGALVILSASSYGKPDKVDNDQTTTGNATGVKMKVSSEWVAAGTVLEATNYANAVERYKDVYTTSVTNKAGNALSETQGWHSATSNTWFNNNENAGLLRASSGSIFAFWGRGRYTTWNGSYEYDASYYTKTYPTRAVVVSGEGL